MRKALGGLVGVVALSLSVMLGAAGTAPVADAVMKRDAEVVRTLIKGGADVNAAQGDGMTALHWAARNGDVELTRVLLYAGANVKASTRLGGYTPLLLAAQQGHAAVIAALITAGSDVKAANALGTTPLMLAAASGDAQTVTMLVENGAEIEAREKTFGQTPLMFAAAANRPDAIAALIKAGADLKVTSKVNNVGSLSGPEQELLAQASGSGNQAGGNGQGRNGQVVAPGTQLDEALRTARGIALMDPNLVAQTKKALNRTYDIQGMRTALQAALDIDHTIESHGSPDKRAFMDVARERGMREAIAWRDARFAKAQA